MLTFPLSFAVIERMSRISRRREAGGTSGVGCCETPKTNNSNIVVLYKIKNKISDTTTNDNVLRRMEEKKNESIYNNNK